MMSDSVIQEMKQNGIFFWSCTKAAVKAKTHIYSTTNQTLPQCETELYDAIHHISVQQPFLNTRR